jgi:hypothetical protein
MIGATCEETANGPANSVFAFSPKAVMVPVALAFRGRVTAARGDRSEVIELT